jgi:hypothetical protein
MMYLQGPGLSEQGTRTLDPGIMSPVERHDEAGLTPSMMTSIMIIATVMIMAMIYAVRFVGCFALILTFLPAALCVSLAKPPRNSLNGRTFWPTLAVSSVFR